MSCEPSLALTGAAFYHKVIVWTLCFIVCSSFCDRIVIPTKKRNSDIELWLIVLKFPLVEVVNF